MIDVTKLDPPPPGFGGCKDCAYRESGSAAICFACASRTMTPVAPDCCPVCDQALSGPGQSCTNHWCGRSLEDRHFTRVTAIAMRDGLLERAINLYKFKNRKAWAMIFGRVLVGFLDEHWEKFWDYDVIAASPSYTGSGARRSWDHIGLILTRARAESDEWHFDHEDPRLIVKVKDTASMTSTPDVYERRRIAKEELGPALRIPDPSRVAGQRILILDDVFTDGTTLREIAMKLRGAGAAEVAGIVLARQPWRH